MGYLMGVAGANLTDKLVQSSLQQSTNGAGRSFESVLQNTQGQSIAGEASQQESFQRINDVRLDKLRTELTEQLNQISREKSFDDLWPELFNNRTRLGLIREAVKGAGEKQSPMDVRGVFGRIESEWMAMEKIMRSDKELSNAELLGVQARMYQLSQHVEVLSKVVDQLTGGVKTVLNTDV